MPHSLDTIYQAMRTCERKIQSAETRLEKLRADYQYWHELLAKLNDQQDLQL